MAKPKLEVAANVTKAEVAQALVAALQENEELKAQLAAAQEEHAKALTLARTTVAAAQKRTLAALKVAEGALDTMEKLARAVRGQPVATLSGSVRQVLVTVQGTNPQVVTIQRATPTPDATA